MKHLADDDALALAEGQSRPDWSRHVEVCSRCRERVASYDALLGLLADTAAETPPSPLLAWARAYAGTRTEARADTRWSTLSFLSKGLPAAASVRGGQALTTALLFGDSSYHLDLRINPAPGERILLHGQIVPLDPTSPGSWEVIAITGDGRLLRTTADSLGEFWFEAGPQWQGTSLVVARDDERLVVSRIGIPDCADELE